MPNPDIFIEGDFAGGIAIRADMPLNLQGSNPRQQYMILTPAQSEKLLKALMEKGMAQKPRLAEVAHA